MELKPSISALTKESRAAASGVAGALGFGGARLD